MAKLDTIHIFFPISRLLPAELIVQEDKIRPLRQNGYNGTPLLYRFISGLIETQPWNFNIWALIKNIIDKPSSKWGEPCIFVREITYFSVDSLASSSPPLKGGNESLPRGPKILFS
jgi:hypothetical protein